MKKNFALIFAGVLCILSALSFAACDNYGYEGVTEAEVSESWVKGVWEVSIKTIRITDGSSGDAVVTSYGEADFTSDEECAKAVEMFKIFAYGGALYQKNNFAHVHYFKKSRDSDQNGYKVYVNFDKKASTSTPDAGGDSSNSLNVQNILNRSLLD